MSKSEGIKSRVISGEEFDRMFDDGEDVSGFLDWSTAQRLGDRAIKRVNVDFPQWMVSRLDREAKRLGVTRQAVIKMLVAEKFDRAA